MTFFQMLHKLILSPIELLFDVIFALSMQMTKSPVLSIVVLSLAINLLVLPLYKKADAMQREEQEISKRLKPRIDQIREVFTGDERFMMLQTYYRQNHYKPYYVLRGSLSLLLQIPFFMAAYNFLSGLSVLQGVSFGPIADLAAPDGILKLGGVTVNLLPVLMTLINIVSGMIYTRGMPLKGKIQLYGMALVFLVLLYDSPAGLVFYWTLNNLFSLGKNILGKLRKPRAEKAAKAEKPVKEYKAVFLACCVLLTVLTGLLIPSAVIHDSPAEFVEINAFRSPLVFVLHSFLLAAGTFLVWCVIFYLLSEKKRRPFFSLVFAFLALGAVVDYMFFGNGYGNMSSLLVYDVDIKENIHSLQILLNTGVLLALGAAVFFLWKKKEVLLRAVCVLVALVITGMSLVNLISVENQVPEIRRLSEREASEKGKIIPLDKTGKNVVVLMLDRACGFFLPYIFAEKPELREQFAGFTAFRNTLSYGNSTHNGSPALFGGYEYTPEKINERVNDTLLIKQNEALRLMPMLFRENGYEVTVVDPPLANYSTMSDLSIYDDDPGIHGIVMEEAFMEKYEKESLGDIEARNRTRERNFFCYSVFRMSPLLLQRKLYESGNYNRTEIEPDNPEAYSPYQAMNKMPEMTRIRADGENTFLMMTSNVAHNPQFLQEPEYVPSKELEKKQYDLEPSSRFAEDGTELVLSTDVQIKHYHVNMAAMLLVGKWLDFMRESGVYDNTRIILVADHGMFFGYPGLCGETEGMDLTNYNPLLMVKEFGSRDPFAFSDVFMTNADTPTLAFRGLIADPVNPATGVPVQDGAKQENEQVVCFCRGNYEGSEETVFPRATYFSVKNHVVMDPENWSVVK